jgi:hypothetical protein
MRSMFRSVLVTLVAVFALGAVAAASASAHEFIVEGKAVAGGEKVAAEGEGGTTTIEWTEGTTKIKVECASSKVFDTLEGGGASEGEVALSSCSLAGSTLCKVPNLLYSTRDQLSGSAGSLVDDFKPAGERSQFFVLEFTGSLCSIKGGYTIEGAYACGLPEVGKEAAEHEIACKPEGSELTFAGKPVRLTSVVKVGLKSGKKWSAS